MLDMGFLPDVRRVLQHLPRPEQTLFFSATLPPPIVELAGEMLHEPARLNVERKSAPATGITQAVYPVQEDLKPYLLVELLRRGDIKNVLVFTRTKHRANRLAEFLDKHGVSCDRIHGNRSQAQRTDALAALQDRRRCRCWWRPTSRPAASTSRRSRTSSTSTCPTSPRTTSTASAAPPARRWWATPSPSSRTRRREELSAIERAVGSRLPRRTVEGFDYEAKPAERFEIPLQERIAAIRARRAEERARAKAKAEKKAQREAEEQARLDQKAQAPHRGAPPSTAPAPAPQQRPAGAGRPGGRRGRSRRVRSARASPAAALGRRRPAAAAPRRRTARRPQGDEPRASGGGERAPPAPAGRRRAGRARSIPRPSRPRSVWRRSAARSRPPASTGSAGSRRPSSSFQSADPRLTRH